MARYSGRDGFPEDRAGEGPGGNGGRIGEVSARAPHLKPHLEYEAETKADFLRDLELLQERRVCELGR